MKILVAGGTSTVGGHLVERLRHDGHDVAVLSRKGPIAGDVTDPDSLVGCCDGREVVFSLVGASVMPTPRIPEQTFEAVDRDGNLALLAEAERAGVTRIVYLSVFGDYPPGIAYVEAHRAVERALEASPVTSTAVRATGFFGALAALRPAARLGLGVRIGDGLSRTNPIHEADLADVLADQVQRGPAALDCGGPEILTRREINERLGGGRVLHIPVPGALVGMSAALTRPVSRRIGDLTTFLRFVLTHDCVAPQFGSRRL